MWIVFNELSIRVFVWTQRLATCIQRYSIRNCGIKPSFWGVLQIRLSVASFRSERAKKKYCDTPTSFVSLMQLSKENTLYFIRLAASWASKYDKLISLSVSCSFIHPNCGHLELTLCARVHIGVSFLVI